MFDYKSLCFGSIMRKVGLVAIGILPLSISFWSIYGQSSPQQRASQQRQLRAGAPGGGVARDTALPAWPQPRNPLDTMTPVTDAMLANPPAADWLTWRRT